MRASNPAPFLGWSHNDELQSNPLTDALGTTPPYEGFEVDVHLVSGELRTGHTLGGTAPGVTLTSQYLTPIAAMATSLHPQVLSVDFKTNPSNASFTALIAELATFSEFTDGHMLVICTGFRPTAPTAHPSYVTFSGGYSKASMDDAEVTQINFNYLTTFDWDGVGRMPDGEYRKLQIMVETCNANGKELRPFFSPSTEAAWQTFYDAGVHWVAPGDQHPPGADDIVALAAWRNSL